MKTICPSTSASAEDCTTFSSSYIRSGCRVTASATSTYTASPGPACGRGGYGTYTGTLVFPTTIYKPDTTSSHNKTSSSTVKACSIGSGYGTYTGTLVFPTTTYAPNTTSSHTETSSSTVKACSIGSGYGTYTGTLTFPINPGSSGFVTTPLSSIAVPGSTASASRLSRSTTRDISTLQTSVTSDSGTAKPDSSTSSHVSSDYISSETLPLNITGPPSSGREPTSSSAEATPSTTGSDSSTASPLSSAPILGTSSISNTGFLSSSTVSPPITASTSGTASTSPSTAARSSTASTSSSTASSRSTILLSRSSTASSFSTVSTSGTVSASDMVSISGTVSSSSSLASALTSATTSSSIASMLSTVTGSSNTASTPSHTASVSTLVSTSLTTDLAPSSTVLIPSGTVSNPLSSVSTSSSTTATSSSTAGPSSNTVSSSLSTVASSSSAVPSFSNTIPTSSSSLPTPSTTDVPLIPSSTREPSIISTTTTVPTPVLRPPYECYKRPWGAPIFETTDDSFPVSEKITQFCKDYNQTSIGPSQDPPDKYERNDISGWDVPQRQSYWLRASTSDFPGCEDTQLISAENCQLTLYYGMNYCRERNENGDDRTIFGFKIPGDGCTDYTLDISDILDDTEPPWNGPPAVRYPPPERVETTLPQGELVNAGSPSCGNGDGSCFWNDIRCSSDSGPGFSMDDANTIIETYCKQDGDYGVVPYGDKNGLTVQAWDGLRYYKNSNWCSGRPNLHVNYEDCAYAFRKLLNTCGTNVKNGVWLYRCTEYYYNS
ncbi:hypothetical protein BDV96DRAFT_578169 [Lophiotrema nucula]|uniref:Uncharacterized protein n=1 Tax=Lophiotrema nucula TaxID=690887 RepID=A0A6A5Z3L4_9PLEO|nr:hypothetical protein BDV96DRAFT_578169 [Lophiotrema nucula]